MDCLSVDGRSAGVIKYSWLWWSDASPMWICEQTGSPLIVHSLSMSWHEAWMDLNCLSQDISCNWLEKSHLLCVLISSCPYFPESTFHIPTAWKVLLLLCWLFNDISIETIKCYMMGWLMNVIQQVEQDLTGENVPQYHFIHHKSNIFRPGTEARSPWWEGSDWAMVWLQVCIMHTMTTRISLPYEMWQLCYN